MPRQRWRRHGRAGSPTPRPYDSSSVAGGHEAAVRFVELVGRACRFDPAPAAVGVNCGLGPEQALKATAAVAYPFGSEEMAGFAIAARRLGTRIVGSRCGVDAAMIGATSETL